MPPETIAEYLDLLRRSGVVPREVLGRYLAGQGNLSPFAPPQELAAAMVRDCLLTSFQADELLHGRRQHFTIGPYRLLQRLGMGSVASVYLGEHVLFPHRRRAIKVMAPGPTPNPTSLERFYRQIPLLHALDHPNVVHGYETDQDGESPYLVLEYVDGPGLHEIVKETGPLNLLPAVHFLRHAAAGLQHLHEAGVVHRNIKPSHLLVDHQGVLKIAGMGLARFSQDQEVNLEPAGTLVGTVDFMSPEQATASEAVDIRGDIYSLGATFYHGLTGVLPFPDGTVSQKLIWRQTRTPRPIREVRLDVPESLATVITRALARQPEQRYQTPAELIQALDGLSLPDDPPSPPPWPAHVTAMALALAEGENCHFALCDALLDAGQLDLAEHFRNPDHRHLKGCWALDQLLSAHQPEARARG
jgi:serine/threonine protein kinase